MNNNLQVLDTLINEFVNQVINLEKLKVLLNNEEFEGLEYLLIAYVFKLFCDSPVPINICDEIQKNIQVEKTFGDLRSLQENINNFLKEDHNFISTNIPKKCKKTINNIKQKVLWMNLSFWDVDFGRMPLIAFVNRDVNKFEQFWKTYWKLTKENSLKGIYTINELVARSNKQITDYVVYFNNSKNIKNTASLKFSINLGKNDEIIKNLKNLNPEAINNKNKQKYIQLYISLKNLWEKSVTIPNSIKCIYFITASLEDIISDTSSSELNRQAILAIAVKDLLQKEEYYFLKIIFNHILIRILVLNFSNKLKREMQISKKHALNSAVLAILTESYSHNIGAHGLEGLKIYLYNQWSDVKNNILKKKEEDSILKLRTELLNKKKIFDKSIKELIKTHSNVPNYLGYLQGKSAFWSAIARGGVLIGGRITNMWELINEFAKNNLLCGSLGASEGYKGIEFYVEYNNGKSVRIGASKIEDDLRYRFEEEGLRDTEEDCLNNYEARTNLTIDNNELDKIKKLKKELEKLQIFLPEGVVGQQAIYTIWENIIRNVKHCKKSNRKDLIPFYIKINNEKNKNWIEVSNWIKLKPCKSVSRKEMNKWEGILNEYYKPNMGGKSQNILCAGIIFGQDYNTTVKLQKAKKNSEKLIRYDINDFVKYTFKIWKGKDILLYEDFKGSCKQTAYKEPIGRFKIVKLSPNEKNEFLKNPFFLRYVIDNDKNKNFYELYSNWVNSWVLNNSKKPKIKIQEKVGHFEGLEIKDYNDGGKYDYYLYHRNPDDTIKYTIKIAYKESDSIGKIINDINIYFNGASGNTDKKKEGIKKGIIELIEILETSFEIFDNRLYILSKKISGKPKITSFNLNIYPEIEDKIPKNNNKNIHFGIFHLSFIERIKNERNEVAVTEFFTNNKILLNRYKIIIITTGRGRNWWDGLDDELKLKIKYIPIENLEKCFEDAKIHAPKTPAIGVKYLLVKTIFGS